MTNKKQKQKQKQKKNEETIFTESCSIFTLSCSTKADRLRILNNKVPLYVPQLKAQADR